MSARLNQIESRGPNTQGGAGRRRPATGRWRRAAASIPVVLALMLVWVVMNEMWNWLIVLSGLLVAVLALVLTRLLTSRDYATQLWIGWLAAIRYFPFLIGQVMVAAVGMVRVILTGHDTVNEFTFVSRLHDEFSFFLLATSIILTPGSIAIGRSGNLITVITVADDVEAARADCARLEASIARFVHSGEQVVG